MYTFIEANTQFVEPKLELMVTIFFNLSVHIVIAGCFVKKARETYDITSITTTKNNVNLPIGLDCFTILIRNKRSFVSH